MKSSFENPTLEVKAQTSKYEVNSRKIQSHCNISLERSVPLLLSTKFQIVITCELELI